MVDTYEKDIMLTTKKNGKIINSLMVDLEVAHNIKTELMRKYGINPRNLLKISSYVDGSFALSNKRANDKCIISNKIIDFIRDRKTDKVYSVKYLYQYSYQAENYYTTEIKELDLVKHNENSEEVPSMLNVTMYDKNKFIDVDVIKLSKDLDFEYLNYFYRIKNI